jgi:hypothetical protein
VGIHVTKDDRSSVSINSFLYKDVKEFCTERKESFDLFVKEAIKEAYFDRLDIEDAEKAIEEGKTCGYISMEELFKSLGV